MLSRYEGKRVRVTTTDRETFVGIAAAYPSGYGLHEFDVEEESLEIGGNQIFLSEIERIEDLSEPAGMEVDPTALNDLMGKLINGPYSIADILPYCVPKDAKGQYFAVERFFRSEEELRILHRKQANVLLKLNCYHDLLVSADGCETWEKNPAPESLRKCLENLSGNQFFRAVCFDEKTMIDIDSGDTYMTVYSETPETEELVRKLSLSEGFFFREKTE